MDSSTYFHGPGTQYSVEFIIFLIYVRIQDHTCDNRYGRRTIWRYPMQVIPCDASRSALKLPTASYAWIAGPIIIAIAGFAVCLAIFFFPRPKWAKRALNQDCTFEKAQLHGDCLPRPLIDCPSTLELEGSFPLPVEMSAEEVRACEPVFPRASLMEASEKPANETPTQVSAS